MPNGDNTLFTVTDLKQYNYCPRILYYHCCLPDIRPTGTKMEVAIRRHEDEPKRALRRTMRIEGLQDAERHFDIPLTSTKLGLTGQVDELIFYQNTIIPVDYKLARKAHAHFRLQLVAYAMLAEEHYQTHIQFGLLYLIQTRKTVQVTFSSQLRQKVLRTVAHMRQITDTEAIPPPPDSVRPCLECEFQRFCNDVI